ncbi:22458_t:CDS:2, partial [Cetraspora pellucida]
MKLDLILNTNKTNISNIEVSYDLNITQTSLTVLQKTLPQSYNYIIDLFKVAQPHNFLGTHAELFTAKFHINICTVNDAKTWLDDKTKEAFFELFHVRHSPASAHYTYLEEIQLKYENDEEILADRTTCPNKQDIYYLYQMFLNKSISTKNGKEMFNRLAEEVMKFNDSKKRSVWMQSYIAPTESDSRQLFIFIILTDLMKHCHTLQQVSKLVYIDTMASLNTLNTPLTIISTSMPVGGLPLA